MTAIVWDLVDDRLYQVGIDRCVLYPQSGPGVPWHGIVSVKEAPEVTERGAKFQDGIRQNPGRGTENFAGTIEAFTYPDEFVPYDGVSRTTKGSQFVGQKRQPFNFAYRINSGESHYKIHLVYNALAQPTSTNNSSLSSGTDLSYFSWNFTTTPVKVDNRFGAHLIIDSRTAYPWVWPMLEDILYGTLSTEPHMPTPTELLALFDISAILIITDHGDGTWSATERPGYEGIIQMLDSTSFEITWPSATIIDADTYTIRSL